MKTALTIAGSDSSGGAGIQADIKTMTANGVYAMSTVTALTAQNTTGVTGIMEVEPEFLRLQLDAVFTDIRPDAVKIGMIPSPALAEIVAERLIFYKAENIVADPVMVATSGSVLAKGSAVEVIAKKILPLCTVATPNIPEAEVLSGISIKTKDDMVRAAEIIGKKCGCAVLCKGGHMVSDSDETACDVLYDRGEIVWFTGERIKNPNTHGTGCTLSSAIASGLAKGYNLKESVSQAKNYLTGALKAQLNLGRGRGPLDHMWSLFTHE